MNRPRRSPRPYPLEALDGAEPRRTLVDKVRLTIAVLRAWRAVSPAVHASTLADLPGLARSLPPLDLGCDPRQITRATHRLVRARGLRPSEDDTRVRCIHRAAALQHVLIRDGIAASLVIGVRRGSSPRAHAWIELGTRPIGPPPGRGDHVELVRYE